MLQWLIKALIFVTAITTTDAVRVLGSPPYLSPHLPGYVGYYGMNVAYGTAHMPTYGPSPYAFTPVVRPYMAPYSGTTLFGYGDKSHSGFDHVV